MTATMGRHYQLPQWNERGHTDWMDQANCQDINPDLFFPDRGDNTTNTAAKVICATCTVRDECLDYALRNRIKFGIWGGKSERERRPLRGAAPNGKRRGSAA